MYDLLNRIKTKQLGHRLRYEGRPTINDCSMSLARRHCFYVMFAQWLHSGKRALIRNVVRYLIEQNHDMPENAAD